jgi:lactate dehydrogenase-like 2-hydroxyacid dehydrogenase
MGIYRDNESSEKIGTFDEELINGLPSSVKWIAHNGASYDPVDVHAYKARGNVTVILGLQVISD